MIAGVVKAEGEEAAFSVGDRVRVSDRFPIGHYRVAIPLTDLWPGYAGSPNDGLRIEVYENWLERTE
jgi:hypothetical protein